MSHSQFHSINCLYLDMHGLIFETSVWLLAGSTRLLVHDMEWKKLIILMHFNTQIKSLIPQLLKYYYIYISLYMPNK